MARNFLVNKFNDIEANNSWQQVFYRLSLESSRQERALKLQTRIAHSIQNVEKNRYRDVAPWDSCRIKLKNIRSDDMDQTDYINASPVDVPGTERHYILSQGPLENTCADFWQMCWENNCRGVIMLNKIVEKGSHKCAAYFPTSTDPDKEFGPYLVSLIDEAIRDNYVVRRIHLTNLETSESREVIHMQYTEWPDFGCPSRTEFFLEFLDDCRRRGLLTRRASDPSPIVHCSAGIGRTGTFIVCDSILSMIENCADAGNVDPEALIIELRKSRVGLIQTAQQLKFCWLAIVDHIKRMPAVDEGTNSAEAERAACVPEEEKELEPEEPADDGDNASNVEILSGTGSKRQVDEIRHKTEDDDVLAKRRATVARMVARLRECEKPMSGLSSVRRTASAWFGGIGPAYAAVAGGVFVLSAVVYFYSRTR